MPFDIDNLNPPERFYYPDSPDEWVEFVLLDADAIEEIDAQTVTKKVEYVQPKKKNGKPDFRRPLQRIEYEVIDEEKRADLMTDAAIHDWHLVKPDGSLIECTTENKLKIVNGSIEFNTWMAECLEIMGERKTEREKELEKNSLKPVSG